MDQQESPERLEDGCYVALTHAPLHAQEIIDRVRSPAAGAIVLFAGEAVSRCCTRVCGSLSPPTF